MPIHDWTRVRAGLFHHFHQRWIGAISDALNGGLLPSGYFALAEQVVSGPIPDVLTLELSPASAPSPGHGNGTAVAIAVPKTRFNFRSDAPIYALKANRVVVRHESGQVIAILEIVSPGNKSSRRALQAFVGKTVDFLLSGIHVLVVDLFPPTSRDPQGIHKAIWDELQEEPFELPSGKPLTVAAYSAGRDVRACVESVAVGDLLPEMPLFLEPELCIPLGLEATYQTTWSVFPAALKPVLEVAP